MTRRTTALLTASVLALGLAACDATAPAGDAPTPAAPDASTSVEIDDFAYDPETTTVAAGTTVTWSNEDATRHTVTAGSEDAPEPDRFDEEVTEQGQTVEVTFDEPGTYAYYCVVHPFMTGTVEVTS